MKTDHCAHEPQDGTIYTTTGLPASLNRRDDFPVEAMCVKCSVPIRRLRYNDPRWIPKPPPISERLAAFAMRHPTVSANENGQASWFGDDGPHSEAFGSAEKMMDYLEARFDRPG